MGGDFEDFGDDFGVLGCDIDRFRGVGIEVVEGLGLLGDAVAVSASDPFDAALGDRLGGERAEAGGFAIGADFVVDLGQVGVWEVEFPFAGSDRVEFVAGVEREVGVDRVGG